LLSASPHAENAVKRKHCAQEIAKQISRGILDARADPGTRQIIAAFVAPATRQ
jgi:hypothetical protein